MVGDARYEAVRGAIPRQTFVSMGSGDRMRNLTGMTVYARTDRDQRQVMGAPAPPERASPQLYRRP